MVAAGDTVKYQGKPMDRLSMERLKSENMMVKSTKFGGEKADITLLQGIGGYVKSGGTHTTGACYDTTAFNWKNRQYVGRLLGGADYHRPYNWDNAKGGEHVHHNTIGVGYASGAAKRQWTAYYAGKNALANNAKDTGPRLKTKPLFVAPWTDRGARGVFYLKKGFTARTEGSTATKSLGDIPVGAKFTVVAVVNSGGVLWAINKDGKHVPSSVLSKTKVTEPSKPTTPTKPPTQKKAVRIGSFNFPDKTKITTGPEAPRIKKAIEQINAADLDILVTQELVGRASKTKASPLAIAFLKALGVEWEMLIPTTDFNENYIFHRPKRAPLIEHFDDTIIRGNLKGAPISGRHLSAAKFDTGLGEIVVGDTQLISSNRPAAEVQARLVASALKGFGNQRVLLGDFNTSGPLSGLTSGGLHNSRSLTKKIGNAQYASFTNQNSAHPSKNPDWIIDGAWVSDGIEVNEWGLTWGLDSNGNFTEPRASDHALLSVELA